MRSRILLVLFAVAIVSACSSPNLKSDRSIGPQPPISPEIRRELSSRKLADFPIYVSPKVTFFDASPLFIKKNSSIFKRKQTGPFHFTGEMPILTNPPAAAITNAQMVLKTLREYLDDNKFVLADNPCESCMTIEIDFANHEYEHARLIIPNAQRSPVIFARERVRYHDVALLNGRDSWFFVTRNGHFVQNDVLQYSIAFKAARQMCEDMLQVWNDVFAQ